MMEPKYYTTKELMDIFRVSRFTIYRANLRGELPIAKKEGTQNLYHEDDVKRYIEETIGTKTQIK